MLDPAAVLARHPFFTTLDGDALAEVSRHAILRSYEKSALIYVEGESAPGLYVVGSGTARVFKTSEDGREQDLFQVSASESLNDASAFDGAPTTPITEHGETDERHRHHGAVARGEVQLPG